MGVLSKLKSIFTTGKEAGDSNQFELELNLDNVAPTTEHPRLDLDIDANIPVRNSSSSTEFRTYEGSDIDE